MYRNRGILALTGAVMCTAGLIPSVSYAAENDSLDSGGSYAQTYNLTASDIKSINEINAKALALGQPGNRAARALPDAAALASDDDRVTPDAEPLSAMPDPYEASGGRAITGVSNYIRKWQQVYSYRDGVQQQMTESQREALSYGCVGVTWLNSGYYPTNDLAFSFFDEGKYSDLQEKGPRDGETRAEFNGRIAKEGFDEAKGFARARDVASFMNDALANTHTEKAYIAALKLELAKNDDALLHEEAGSEFYSALKNTPSFKEADGGNSDPSKMKAVIYSKHFWSGQHGSSSKKKYGAPEAFRPEKETGLVDMSQDDNISRSPASPDQSWVNFDYGWLGDQAEMDESETIWTHANHYNAPNGDMGPMNVYESEFPSWSSGYEDFDRGTYEITFIPKSWNTAPAKVTQGWQ
ncbi:protein-glutamine gamma-glutamyltransferase [Streptomyces sp. NPDC055085]